MGWRWIQATRDLSEYIQDHLYLRAVVDSEFVIVKNMCGVISDSSSRLEKHGTDSGTLSELRRA